MQDYCLCVRRNLWMDSESSGADPYYINTEVCTVNHSKPPRGAATRTELGMAAAIESITICNTHSLKTSFETRGSVYSLLH